MAFADNQGSRVILNGWPEKGLPLAVTASETVKKGDLVFVTSGTITPVDSDDAEHGRLIAGADGAAGEYVPCYWCALIDGFTDATSGAAIYTGTTAGTYTETADTSSGDSNEIVGYMLTATIALVLPAVRADSLAA
jgi:hypothetical protein